MPICNTCFINRQDIHCQRHLCYDCCSSQPYVYQACPLHDIARPPTSIPSSAQRPDRFIAPVRPRSSSASHTLSSMSNINNSNGSAPVPPASSVNSASSLPSSSSAPAPASSSPVTLDVITSLFQRVEATLAADRAAASTAAETAAAQIAALTNTVALLQAVRAPTASASAASPSSSSAASCSSSPPSATRADAVLGVDPTAINNLIASLSSASTQVPATHKASGVTAAATDHTTTATATGPTLSSPNPFILLNDELTAAAPGRPEHLIHALTTALTDGSKAAKRFKTKDEFSKALTTQYLSFVSSSSPTALLSAWYRYTVFLLSLDFQQAQDYHFELSQRMKAGEHDLVRDTHMNNEVYFTCVVQSKRSIGGGRSGGSNYSSKRSYKPHSKSQHCDMHGECGHSTADCKGIAAGSKKKPDK